MFRNRSRRFWIILVVVVAAVVFYLPSLVAFRYTASPQNTSFLIHPWHSWDFAWTALTVPGNAKLKTSGEALRAAKDIWRGSKVDPLEVRVLFLDKGRPYTFTHDVDGREISTTVTPPYAFVWQVRGTISGKNEDSIVGLLDYRTGDVLYDVRTDLGTAPTPAPTATPTPTGGT